MNAKVLDMVICPWGIVSGVGDTGISPVANCYMEKMLFEVVSLSAIGSPGSGIRSSGVVDIQGAGYPPMLLFSCGIAHWLAKGQPDITWRLP